MKKNKIVFILIILMVVVVIFSSSVQASFIDRFRDMLEDYEMSVLGIYSGVPEEKEESYNQHLEELSLRINAIHKENDSGVQLSWGSNSIQLGLRQYYRDDYFFGGHRMYIEPAIATRDFSSITYGGYAGVFISGMMPIDISVGLEAWTDNDSVEISPLYRIGMGISF